MGFLTGDAKLFIYMFAFLLLYYLLKLIDFLSYL